MVKLVEVVQLLYARSFYAFEVFFSKLTDISVHNLALRSNCDCYCDKIKKKFLATVLILRGIIVGIFWLCRISMLFCTIVKPFKRVN